MPQIGSSIWYYKLQALVPFLPRVDTQITREIYLAFRLAPTDFTRARVAAKYDLPIILDALMSKVETRPNKLSVAENAIKYASTGCYKVIFKHLHPEDRSYIMYGLLYGSI
jgi:hypothetical protein